MNGVEIVIPSLVREFEQIKLPDPDDLIYFQNLQQRLFYVEGVIVQDLESGYSDVGQLIKKIITINIEDRGKSIDERKPIIIAIDSPGGDLDLSFALADTIRASVTPIYTLGLSSVMSGAFIAFLGGKKRYLLPHTQILCHQGSASMSGNANELSDSMRNYKKTLDRMKDYILETTNIDAKTFSTHRKADWYISTDDAVNKYGIADKIITNMDEVFDL